jgi:hypothetical protein
MADALLISGLLTAAALLGLTALACVTLELLESQPPRQQPSPRGFEVIVRR